MHLKLFSDGHTIKPARVLVPPCGNHCVSCACDDFAYVKFIGYSQPQVFSPSKYFVISDLQKILCTQMLGTSIM